MTTTTNGFFIWYRILWRSGFRCSFLWFKWIRYPGIRRKLFQAHFFHRIIAYISKERENYSLYETCYELSRCDAGQRAVSDKKDLKNPGNARINKNRDDTNHGKNKKVSLYEDYVKKDWKWTEKLWFCSEGAIKDTRLCAVCGLYVHKECVRLIKVDTDLFICSKCQQ